MEKELNEHFRVFFLACISQIIRQRQEENKPKDPHYDRYSSDPCLEAVEAYHDLAIKNGLTLTELALAFVNDRSFVTSNIIGATDLTQLKENINTANIKLAQEVIDAINEIHEAIPNPSV